MVTTKSQDAIALLKEDHRKVEDLFEQFEKAKGDGRKQKLALEICTELTIHTVLEEEIFYPALEGKIDEDLLKESFVEHDAAKVMIAEIEAGEPSDEFYDAKVKVLSEEIEHHVEEEEKPKEGFSPRPGLPTWISTRLESRWRCARSSSRARSNLAVCRLRKPRLSKKSRFSHKRNSAARTSFLHREIGVRIANRVAIHRLMHRRVRLP
ncbi:hemerythrin domain-containing protein [Sphingomonas sediminicola]|uniref:hemerythrin domain-containing protein n=1 Tax=Sphingomonas sediminicola TaxID=386874 RepID=UPI003CCD286A